MKYFDCQVGLGREYKGPVNISNTGKKCQKWSKQTPHEHQQSLVENHNECRNPDGSGVTLGAWCYTMDEDTRWEYCDVCWCQEDNGRTTIQ